MIKVVRDDHAATARKANKIKQMISRLYSWADENDLVPAGLNPTKGLKRLRRKGGEREITVWSDEEIELLRSHASPLILTAVSLAIYTGQRLSDLVRMSWAEFQGSTIRVRQSKTKTLLDIACHPVLRAHLETLPRGSIHILTRDGKPMSPNALAGALRREVERIPEMPKPRSMHGLRYAAASRMEEGGATVAEIDAVLGHRTFRMALKYASQRLRAKAGVSAMGRRNRGQ
jgi:integrase